MTADEEKMWAKLKEPWYEGRCKISFNNNGTVMFRDIFGDGAEVEVFDVAVPFVMASATYRETEYCSAWGMV